MNINVMMQQDKKMQVEMATKKTKISAKKITIKKQGVSIAVKEDGTIKSIKIHKVLIDLKEKETFEDMIVIAVNTANAKIDEKKNLIQPQTDRAPL